MPILGVASRQARRHSSPDRARSDVEKPIEISDQSDLAAQARDKAKRSLRKVKPGYPRTKPFSTSQEVYDYLNQDEIDCLLCGARKQGLAAHLARIHRVSVLDYKERFGLPYRCGLTSARSREKRKDSWEARPPAAKAATTARLRAPEAQRLRREAVKTQRTSGLKRMVSSERAAGFAPKTATYTAEHALSVISFMEREKVTLVVAREYFNIGHTTFFSLLNQHPEIRERYENIARKACWAERVGRRHAAKRRNPQS